MLVHAHELTRAQLAWLEEVKANGGKEKRPQPKMENMAVVGLLLSKYVADTEASDWSDTIIHEDQARGQAVSREASAAEGQGAALRRVAPGLRRSSSTTCCPTSSCPWRARRSRALLRCSCGRRADG